MAFTTYFVFVALLIAASANPLGPTTVCETTCETTQPSQPNQNYYGYGYGYLPCQRVEPNIVPYGYIPYKIPHIPHTGHGAYGSHGTYGTYGTHGGHGGYGGHTSLEPVQTATICETMSLPFNSAHHVPTTTATVCETVPVPPVVPSPLPLPIYHPHSVCDPYGGIPGIPLPLPGLIPGFGVNPGLPFC